MAEIAGNWTCTVRTNTGVILRVRNQPSLSGSIVGKIPNGSTVHATKENNGWYYITEYGGWSSGEWMNVSGGPSNTTATQGSSAATVQEKTYMSWDESLNRYIASTDGAVSIDGSVLKNLNGIWGIPYQFMSSVDQRIEGSTIGRTYADKIISRMPLLLLTPGKVNFLRDYVNQAAGSETIMKLIDKVSPTDLDSVVEGIGRYYSFDFDYVNYYSCVNQMIASGAVFLNLHNTSVNVAGKWQKLSGVNWSECGNNGFKGILSSREYVAFYIDSTNQISESFQNTTGESQLASSVNSVSDIGREIQFLLGYSGITDALKDQDALNSAMQKVEDISKKYLSGNKLLSDISKQFGTVAVGGKLLFPEIWNDSTFTKSYNIQIKLRTPDGDKLSWFMNIYVPLCHLICLTAPVQTDYASGYKSPFLVRGYYRGMFNCDMGIITDLNITKGKEGAWTIDGLPTEVDVDLTLKDLYSAMSITGEADTSKFVNNICLVDYIANTCGVNINEPDFGRQFALYAILKVNKWKHIVPDIWYTVEQDISNKIMDLFSKTMRWLP